MRFYFACTGSVSRGVSFKKKYKTIISQLNTSLCSNLSPGWSDSLWCYQIIDPEPLMHFISVAAPVELLLTASDTILPQIVAGAFIYTTAQDTWPLLEAGFYLREAFISKSICLFLHIRDQDYRSLAYFYLPYMLFSLLCCRTWVSVSVAHE